MKFTFIKTDKRQEVIVYNNQKDDFVNTVEALCGQTEEIIGYAEGVIKKLSTQAIECFVTVGDKIYAIVNEKRYLVKERLYVLAEKLGHNFLFINQGCLANFYKIDYFDASISGTLVVYFKSGYKDYVSRRNMKNIKERLGLR